MSNKTTFEVQGIAKLDISQVKQAAEQIKTSMQGVTLPGNIDKNLASIFQKLNNEISEFEVNSKKAKTNADWSSLIKSGEKILGLYSKMEGQIKQLGDISATEMKSLFPPEVTANIKKAEQALKDYTKATNDNANAVKKQQAEIDKLTKKQNKAKANKDAEQGKTQVSNGEYKAMIDQQKALGKAAADAAGEVDRLQAKYDQLTADRAGKRGRKPQELIDTQQQLEQAKNAYAEATQAAQAFDQKMQSTTSPKIIAELDKALNEVTVDLDAAKQKMLALAQNDTTNLNQLFTALSQIDGIDLSNVTRDLQGAQTAIANLTADEIKKVAESLTKFQSTADSASPAMDKFRGSVDDTKTSIQDLTSMQGQVDALKNSFMHFFSLTNGWMLLRRGIRAAYESVKEMDDAMTEIAVVSDYTLDDIWAMRDGYVKSASDMGAATIDLVNATKLYVQQGMNLTEAQEVGIETTKMARIANLDGAEATNLMTAALRGFNMEMNEANRVNDVYSQLAAKSAADTEEIATAMSKTASIAANAGASFENTSAFLTQIIETTREAPETAGTALKTIIARFQELKKAPGEIGEVDGEMVDANAIETALKTAGVALRDMNGEFRNFDDVIIELAGKWDSLDVMTQRYIATMAAGSRQQSRFIALMADSERLMELTGYAANSAGASNEQFEKTLDSLESKVNKLKNAWDLYLQNLANSTVIKGAIDLLTELLTAINNITAGLNQIDSSGIMTSIIQTLLTFFAFKGAGALISKLFTGLGATFFKQGATLGKKTAAGMNYGITAGITSIKSTWKKFTAWLSKTKVNIFNNKKTVAQAKNEIKAIGDVKRAKRAYDAEVKASGANSQKAVAAQNNLINSQKNMTNAMQLSGDQIQTYNMLTNQGIAADTAALAAKNGLTKADIDEATASLRAAGASQAEIDAKIKEIAANNAAAGSETMLNNAKKATLGTRLKALWYIVLGNKEKTVEILKTYGLVTAEQADALMKSQQTGAQWALNAATYAFPGMWLLLIILAIVAAVALLVVGIVALTKSIETDSERMERFTKNAEEAKEAAERAAEAYETFKEDVGEYKEGVKGIGELTKGTQKYTEAIMESNARTLELISTYGTLATGLTINEDGLMEINQHAIELYSMELMRQATMMRAAEMFAQAELTQEQNNQRRNNAWENAQEQGDFSYYVYYDVIDIEGTATVVEESANVRKTGPGENAKTKSTVDHNGMERTRYLGAPGENDYIAEEIALAEDQVLDIASTMLGLKSGTDAYNKAIADLSAKYGYESAMLEQVISSAIKYKGNLDKAAAALSEQTKAAVAYATQMRGLVRGSHQSAITETLSTGLNQYNMDFAVGDAGGTKDRATYMGDQAIGDSDDKADQGMKNFQQDYNTVLRKMGQEEVAWTDANSEKATLTDIVLHNDPEKEITAKGKHLDDEGEGLGDEFDNIAQTTYVQMNAIILDEVMQTTAGLEEMLSGKMGEGTVDYDTLVAALNANETNRERDGAFTNTIVKAVYTAEHDQLDEQSKKYEKMASYFDVGYDTSGIQDKGTAATEAQNKLLELEKNGTTSGAEYEAALKEYANAVAAYGNAQAEAVKVLYTGDKKIFSDLDQMNEFAEIADQMSSQVGQAMASAFQTLEVKNKDEFLSYLSDVGDSAIKTAAAIRAMAESENADIQEAAMNMGLLAADALSAQNQVNELYNTLGDEAMAKLAEDGEITALEMMELAKSNELAATMMDNTGVSASALAEYYELLEEGIIDASSAGKNFIQVLSDLNASQNTIEDSFAFIDSYDPGRSQTEIATGFIDYISEFRKLYEQGAYGDEALKGYAKAIMGDNWETIENDPNLDNKQKADMVYQKISSMPEEGGNMYTLWEDFAQNSGSGLASMGGSGEVVIDTSQITSIDELKEALMAYGYSAEFADAMIADLQTNTTGLDKVFKNMSLKKGLQTFINSGILKKSDGKKILQLNDKQLAALAKQMGKSVEETKKLIEDELAGQSIEVEWENLVNADGKLSDSVIDQILSDGTIGDSDIKMLVDLGFTEEEAKTQLAELMSDADRDFSGIQLGFDSLTTEQSMAYLGAMQSGTLTYATALGITDGYESDMVQKQQQLETLKTEKNMAMSIASGMIAGSNAGLLNVARGFDKIFKTNTAAAILANAQSGAIATLGANYDKKINGLNAEIKNLNLDSEIGNLQGKMNDITAAFDSLDIENPVNTAYEGAGAQNVGRGTSGKEEEAETWKEDYDWLYNMEKELEAIARNRNRLETEYNRLIENGNYTRKQLLDLLETQEKAEETQLKKLAEEKRLRELEAKALENEFSDVSKYAWWSEAEQRVIIDEDAMRADQDSISEEFGERIDEFITEGERVAKELEEIDDDILDIKEGQADRLNEQLDAYADLEGRVKDAIISQREKEIEALESLNDTISNANSELLDKIQTGIDDSRQARENEESLQDIEEMERRLALLRSDTSGANALDILSLEEELEQARQDFMDNKIDQAIEELSRQNEIAQKQREIQIERMTKQLEEDQENGNIAKETNRLMSEFLGNKPDQITSLLQNEENWAGMAAQEKQQWADDLILATTLGEKGWMQKYSTTNLVKDANEPDVKTGKSVTITDSEGNQVRGVFNSAGAVVSGRTTYTGIYRNALGQYVQSEDGATITVPEPAKPSTTPTTSTGSTTSTTPANNTTQTGDQISDAIKKKVALAIWNGNQGWGSGKDRSTKLTAVFGSNGAKDIQKQVNRGWQTLQKEVGTVKYSDYSYSAMKAKKWAKYETGGLADFTGPAWLDGTKAHPEYVLNAEQTQGFLALVDMLGDLDDNPTAGGNNYYDVRIEVDELSNDYDVEQMMDKMKRVITDDAMYRNVNAIDLGRR